MITLSAKNTALAAILALGVALSSSAQAGILRTADGTPVLTKEGVPVLTGDFATPDCEPAASAPAPAVEKDDHKHERVVYFDFNKSTLTPLATHQLNRLAKRLVAHSRHGHIEKSITIIGYADRMGKADYNERLALKRAKAVHDYLASKGVKAKKIEVRSLGKSAPKADCAADLPRAQMIECLKEDRRVEIEFGTDK